jgi:hypothetical protein
LEGRFLMEMKKTATYPKNRLYLLITALFSVTTSLSAQSLSMPYSQSLTGMGDFQKSLPIRDFRSSQTPLIELIQSDSTPKEHSPKKATLLALALPGAGQIYNQKYWKAPIVYAGLGASIYAIGMFRKNMNTLNDSITGIYLLGKTPSSQLINDRDNQRSRRDIAILCLAGVYVLQILDATVDAHFYKFNINDKIGMELSPLPNKTIAFHIDL